MSEGFKFSNKLMEDCKKQYKEDYNLDLSDDEAQDYLKSLADLFDLVTGKDSIRGVKGRKTDI